ncbi:MAG: glutathione S-transferase family protein [Pseudomonadota bacterium]
MTVPAYAVVGHPQTRAFRVMWMLEELGLPYEVEPVAPHSDRAKALNPSAKVPVLLVDGAPFSDSLAILHYLADRHAAHAFPPGSLERLRQDGAAFAVLDEIEGPLWTTAKHKFALPENRRRPEVIETCAWEFQRGLKGLAARFGEGPWIMGDTFTVPDLLAGHCLDWARMAFKTEFEGPIAAYRDRLRARPAYGRAAERTKAILDAA